MKIEQVSSNKCFGGWHKQFSHDSEVLHCSMRFAVYLPPQSATQSVPVLYWLSGLICNDENFMQKSGAMRVAAELGMVIVAPDTSPRGVQVPDDPDGAYDFGLGAGFYLNATQPLWSDHYQMYDYILKELPHLIELHFPVTQERSISGHSMGGHGALSIALKNPDRYKSASAFSPICNPVNCAWGEKAFSHYLGDDKQLWAEYDSSELMKKFQGKPVPMLVDQGEADDFLVNQLKPEVLEKVISTSNYPAQMRRHQGYDHSYYFVASFIEEHLRFHAEHLEPVGLNRP